MTIVFGYISSILMGSVLGLIGAGGSILTVPILVYLFDIHAVHATAYSLFIVGLTAVFGGFQYYRKNLINFKVGFIFAVPAFIGVFAARKFIIPNLPDEIFSISSLVVTKDIFIMLVFSIVMLLAAISMLRDSKDREVEKNKEHNYLLIAIEGLVVGGITGFVGAGGGFLIIPGLVILAGLEMKEAVGTSLMIIAIKSLLGFTGDVMNHSGIDWQFLGIFSFLSIIGIFIGVYAGHYIPGKKLKPMFGWFVLILGAYIIYKESMRIFGM